MSVDEPIQLDVIVVFAERVDEHFSYFQPANVETELDRKLIKAIEMFIMIV